MTERSATNSYIVRVYRYDTDDEQQVIGLVEILDGSGERTAFRNMEELASLLKTSHRTDANNRNTGGRKWQPRN